ncbi:hypothetical protein [Snodgrassella gandavensis]
MYNDKRPHETLNNIM